MLFYAVSFAFQAYAEGLLEAVLHFLLFGTGLLLRLLISLGLGLFTLPSSNYSACHGTVGGTFTHVA